MDVIRAATLKRGKPDESLSNRVSNRGVWYGALWFIWKAMMQSVEVHPKVQFVQHVSVWISLGAKIVIGLLR